MRVGYHNYMYNNAIIKFLVSTSEYQKLHVNSALIFIFHSNHVLSSSRAAGP